MAMPSGKFTKTSMALVAANASNVAQGICIPKGSTKMTARWCFQLMPLSRMVWISARSIALPHHDAASVAVLLRQRAKLGYPLRVTLDEDVAAERVRDVQGDPRGTPSGTDRPQRRLSRFDIEQAGLFRRLPFLLLS